VAQKLHLKPSSRQAPKSIPYVTHDAAERHLCQSQQTQLFCNIKTSSGDCTNKRPK
jgi:hypothetical protein